MKKNRIRLTESQLHKVIKESVKRVLFENKFDGNSKTKPYDINSKKYKKMFDKGSNIDNNSEDMDSFAQEFLNRPNAAQDFKNFPRFSTNRDTNYDNLANGSPRINQYKQLLNKRKQVGTIEHFENWLKERGINGLDEFYHEATPLQSMTIEAYAHMFNLSKKDVSMMVY